LRQIFFHNFFDGALLLFRSQSPRFCNLWIKYYFLRPEKIGALDFKNLLLQRYFINLCHLNWINSSFLILIKEIFFVAQNDILFWEIKVLKSVNKKYFCLILEKVGKKLLNLLIFQNLGNGITLIKKILSIHRYIISLFKLTIDI